MTLRSQLASMTDSSSNLNEPASSDTLTEATTLLQQLRRKEGTWVEWGQACQLLQKAHYSPQTIFEETGFEPIQQNQIIVAAQVYTSIVSGGASAAAQQHFSQRGSDILYELRILSQSERVSTAELVLTRTLDADVTREIVKAVKDYSRLSKLPEGFSDQAGDAIAYHYWRLARQQSDLQERSQLIAKAFSFVNSNSARTQIEKLLTDFSVIPSRKAPFWPIYRLDTDELVPQILPVVGRLPLNKADVQVVPVIDLEQPFNIIRFSGQGALVALPGWQVILNANDPIVILASVSDLPTSFPIETGEALVVVDRAQRTWNCDSYFLYEDDINLGIQWFAEPPAQPLLGQIVLVMMPKKVLDEDYTKELWQIDE
jgi:hypothetical protein